MSFSSKVKDNLCHVDESSDCCRKAEFIAFFMINGSIRICGQHQLSVFMQTEHPASVRRIFSLAREFSLEREISVHRRTRLYKNRVFTLIIPPQEALSQLLRQLNLIDENGSWQMVFPRKSLDDMLVSQCCRRAYLRGAFLASGSLSQPETAYHLEFGSLEKDQAALLIDILEGFGLHGKSVRRKDAEIVYLKGADEISQLLVLMGSHQSLLEFESVRVNKEVRNQVNRQRNCDTANVNKVVSAGVRQVEMINYIVENIGWQVLPDNLRIAAELRLEYPNLSLTELSEISAIGRSALNHRLRRLKQIAENIRDYGAKDWNHREIK